MFKTPSLFNRGRNVPALRERGEADPFFQFHRDMNRLFDDFFDGFSAPPLYAGNRSGARAAYFDINETKKAFEVEVELPGVDEDDVSVELTDNLLTIRGERKYEKDDDEEGVSERSYASFERSMSLPFDVDPDAVKAKFKNGVLKLKLPKTPEMETRTKRIAIDRG